MEATFDYPYLKDETNGFEIISLPYEHDGMYVCTPVQNSIQQRQSYKGKKCQKPSKLGNILVFEMRKLHFLKIPFGFDFKFNYSDKYDCNGGQNYENLI